MIIQQMIITMIGTLNGISSFFPNVDKLPWGIDDIITSAVGGYKELAIYLPVLNTILIAFTIYLGFRITLMVFKMIPFIGRSIE